MKVFFKINLFMIFHIFKLNDLKVIHDLYLQCLTQTLSKTTSNREPEGVLSRSREDVPTAVYLISHKKKSHKT
jgi:hypothetical protein